MSAYKNFAGSLNSLNSLNLYLSLVAALFIFFQASVLANTCTIYVVADESVLNSTVTAESSIPYSNVNDAIERSVPGEVICFKSGVYTSVRIEGVIGQNEPITLMPAPDNQVVILSDGYSGTGIYIKDSEKIVISGFTISGGLYGIYSIGSSSITVTDNTIYDVGQEAIIIKSGISTRELSNFVVTDNVITGTGKTNSQYGEGIYIGDGNDNYNKVLNNITIQNNNISKTTNEAIDIKINTNNITIDSNTIVNTSLKWNGAITVATSDRFGAGSNISINKNSIVGVTNRLGYRAIGIAIGHGDALIQDNMIIEQGSHFAGVCLFSTFMNPDANTVTLSNNQVITSGSALVKNCGSGGTGANELANIIELDD